MTSSKERQYLDFNKEIPENEQEWYLVNNWCEQCNVADTGIKNPKVYREEGKKFLEGRCKVCGSVNATSLEGNGH